MDRFLKSFKKYFIPHKDNDFHPHLLRHRSILALFLIVILFEIAFLVQIFIVFDKTKFLASVLPGVLTMLTNEERANFDLNNLKENSLLQQAAQAKADDMANRGYFSHNTPEGKTPWYWLELVGYKYKYAGENLAVNFFESAQVARAWMNSPTHKANIIKKDYTEIGIAVAEGIYKGQNTVFVVQFFGTPKEDNKTNINTQEEIIKEEYPAEDKFASMPSITEETNESDSVLGEEILEITNTEENPNTNITTPTREIPLKIQIQKIMASPSILLTYIFIFISTLIGFLIILTLFIRSEKQHPRFMAQGLFLISVIIALFFLNINISNHKVDLPLNSELNTTFAN